MGLTLTVGRLASVLKSDQAYSERLRARFERVGEYVLEHTSIKHQEPQNIADTDQFDCQMWGYSGLHHLRMLAAHVATNTKLYAPGKELPKAGTKVVEDYYEQIGFADDSNLPFQHLMLHGDASGYYVPVRFGRVIVPGDDFDEVGGPIGSSYTLLDECRSLAQVLCLPLDLDIESDEVWRAAERTGSGEHMWQKYGIESFSCIRLARACEVSIKLCSAVSFV